MNEIEIDFQILETRNPKLLMIGDTSNWSYAEELPSYIAITMPGSDTPLNLEFVKGIVKTYNSSNLALTCQSCDDELANLPDGVYTITVKSGYEDIERTKYYLKTDTIRIELAKEIVKNGFEYSPSDKKFRENIYDIKWLLDVAQSHAILGDFCKAQNYYEMANAKLCCKNCI